MRIHGENVRRQIVMRVKQRPSEASAQALDCRRVSGADIEVKIRRTQAEIEQDCVAIACSRRIAIRPDFGHHTAAVRGAIAGAQAQRDARLSRRSAVAGENSRRLVDGDPDRPARGDDPRYAVGLERFVSRAEELGHGAKNADAPAGRRPAEVGGDQVSQCVTLGVAWIYARARHAFRLTYSVACGKRAAPTEPGMAVRYNSGKRDA